jgi:hypothetical protein
VVSGASEHEGEDERVDRREGESAKDGKRDDEGGRAVGCGAEENSHDNQQEETDAIERGLWDAYAQCGDEETTGELCCPEVEGYGRRLECGVCADGITGKPASEGVLDTDVEEHGSGKDE